MKMRCFALALMVPAVLGGLACQGKKKSSGTPFSAGNMVGSETGISHVDEHYRFSIRGLGPQWRLLDDKEREGLLPDAAALATRVGGAYGALIVEPYEGEDLKSFMALIVSNMEGMSTGFEAGEVREIDFNGGKALRRSMKATLQEIDFDYEVMTFLHQGMGYQALAWKPRKMGAREPLDEFIASIGMEKGLVKSPPPPPAPDSIGVGNRIRDGRFESAVSQLSVKPADGWGLMWGQSLANTGDDAETGIERPDQGVFISVSHQPVAAGDRERFLGSLEGILAGEAKPVGKASWNFGGEPLECVAVIMPGPPATKVFLGHLVRGDRGYRVKAWHLDQADKDRSQAIAEGMASFSFLAEKAVGELRGQLEAEADTHGSVGEHYSLRDGVFRAFSEGLVWKRPEGFWQVDAGDAARMRNEDCMLHATDVESGMSLQVLVEDAAGLSSREFHGNVVARMEAGRFARSPKQLEPVMVDGHEVLRSCLLYQGEDADIEYHANTVVVGDKAYQLNCFAPVVVMAGQADLVARTLGGFSFPGGKLRAVESRGGRHRDVRMGFEIRPAAGMAAVPHSNNELVSKIGSCAEFRGKSGMISHLAIQAGGAGNDASIAGNLVSQMFKLNLDRSTSAGSAEKTDTIGGLPATVRSGVSDDTHLRIAVFRQGGILHMGVVVAGSERKVESLYADYKAGFRLIP